MFFNHCQIEVNENNTKPHINLKSVQPAISVVFLIAFVGSTWPPGQHLDLYICITYKLLANGLWWIYENLLVKPLWPEDCIIKNVWLYMQYCARWWPSTIVVVLRYPPLMFGDYKQREEPATEPRGALTGSSDPGYMYVPADSTVWTPPAQHGGTSSTFWYIF